jgi:hypothetical protein
VKFQDHILSGASNTTSSQACVSVMLMLLINFMKYEFGVGCSGKMSNPNFIKINPVVLELKHRTNREDRTKSMIVHSTHIVQKVHNHKNNNNNNSSNYYYYYSVA